MAQLLILWGADVNADTRSAVTPLQWAAYNGHSELVEVLVAAGSAVNPKRGVYPTPLHSASRLGHYDAAALLIAHGADVNSKRTQHSWTPLHLAVMRRTGSHASRGIFAPPLPKSALPRHRKVIELLLANGAKVDAWDESGRTPLELAVSRHDRQSVKLLIAHGADVNRRGNGGRTPLHIAAERGQDTMTTQTQSTLTLPRLDGRGETIVDVLIARGAVIDAPDDNGLTPLHLAAGNGHEDVVASLIANEANIRTANKRGQTAIDIAEQGGHRAVVGMLQSWDQAQIRAAQMAKAHATQRAQAAQQRTEATSKRALSNLTVVAVMSFPEGKYAILGRRFSGRASTRNQRTVTFGDTIEQSGVSWRIADIDHKARTVTVGNPASGAIHVIDARD